MKYGKFTRRVIIMIDSFLIIMNSIIYCLIIHQCDLGISLQELDEKCELLIKEQFNENCNFDIDDAIHKLEKLGIVYKVKTSFQLMLLNNKSIRVKRESWFSQVIGLRFSSPKRRINFVSSMTISPLLVFVRQ